MRNAKTKVTRLRPVNDIDDASLVTRIRKGDRQAMEALYQRYVHRITGIAAKLLRNSADIEDVVQDTFIQGFRDIESLKDPYRVERWLARIAVHRAHRRFRRRKLKRSLGLDRSFDDERMFVQAEFAASQEARAEIALLDEVFDTMGMADRTCFVLRYLEGYLLEEVATITGCSLATAKRRIARAKSLVDQHFKEDLHG